ncbi:MAG TPA: hypothetical protein VLF39_01115 [Candidatus Saccharimonadales bacterium]|nr:hypothetical protein [Candidatus Saccharimonadales bacterium]
MAKVRRQRFDNFEHSAKDLARVRLDYSRDGTFDLDLMEGVSQFAHALGVCAMSKGQGSSRARLEALSMRAMQNADNDWSTLADQSQQIVVDESPTESILGNREQQ